jgi:hypothetical protein
MKRYLCTLGLLLAAAAVVRADVIRLKDGSKIVGTIVDFQNDSFKVQTSYGFAMVRKDRISQIIPSDPGKAGGPASDAAPATAAASGAKAEARPTASRGRLASHPAPTAVNASRSIRLAPAVAAGSFPMPEPLPRTAPPAPVAAVDPAPTPEPVPPPVVPTPIRDSVNGNLYINETYDFQFYRPPGWDVIPGARGALPNAITAMGTSDKTTLFLVGRELWQGSLEVQASNAEQALRKIYENYRPISSTKRVVNGLPAMEWRFRGVADGHDWSVTALTIAHNADVFTLLGMTYSDSDLIQIRENVIAKMIGSLRFGQLQPR